MPTADDGTRKAYATGPEDQRLRMIEREIDLGEDGRYMVAVGGDAAEIEDEIAAFDMRAADHVLLLAAVLLLTTLFQVRFGLAPLKRISEGLAAIRSGSAERLEGRFPEEIAPLARETNALLDANREIVERARTHVGNLAHALKTPISVMINEAAARERRSARRQGVGADRDHARPGWRAISSGRGSRRGSRWSATLTDVVPVVRRSCARWRRRITSAASRSRSTCRSAARFRGERQDLEEMVGNLLDNAFKWAGLVGWRSRSGLSGRSRAARPCGSWSTTTGRA